jgi:hypothetical protein
MPFDQAHIDRQEMSARGNNNPGYRSRRGPINVVPGNRKPSSDLPDRAAKPADWSPDHIYRHDPPRADECAARLIEMPPSLVMVAWRAAKSGHRSASRRRSHDFRADIRDAVGEILQLQIVKDQIAQPRKQVSLPTPRCISMSLSGSWSHRRRDACAPRQGIFRYWRVAGGCIINHLGVRPDAAHGCHRAERTRPTAKDAE